MILGNIDISCYLNLLDQYDDWDNQEGNQRAKIFKVHENTETIPILWSLEKILSGNDASIASPKCALYDKYYIPEFFTELSTILGDHFGDGYFINIMLTKLHHSVQIYPHVDSGPTITDNIRVHVPLITHESVLFLNNGVQHHYPAGCVFVVNNSDIHAVSNNSKLDRVHLIVDWHVKH